jgi:7,8-dihydropterin-6-yl-methyl-4-(beta-D-ribofuranosyl)aminobenzene 5'-phosphate synthase
MRLAALVLCLSLAACAGSATGTVPPASPPAASPLPAPPSGVPAPQPRETARAVKVTILSTMLADEGIGEWGFSALVEIDGRALLFDTGKYPDTVLRNAETLKVDLSRVTDVVLSHNHGDHTGGLVALRRGLAPKNPAALSRAHVAPPIFWSRPRPTGDENPMVAARREYEALGGAFVEHRGFDRLAPGVYLTGPVPRVHPEKNYGRGGHIGPVLTPTGIADDDVPEDMSLVIETPEGLVLVVGCGHAGIVNTLEDAVKQTGDAHVHAAIGGFHLFEASEDTLAWTARSLAPMHLAYFVGAHCTGLEATYRLRALLGLERKTAVVGAVGATFELGKGLAPGAIAH